MQKLIAVLLVISFSIPGVIALDGSLSIQTRDYEQRSAQFVENPDEINIFGRDSINPLTIRASIEGATQPSEGEMVFRVMNETGIVSRKTSDYSVPSQILEDGNVQSPSVMKTFFINVTGDYEAQITYNSDSGSISESFSVNAMDSEKIDEVLNFEMNANRSVVEEGESIQVESIIEIERANGETENLYSDSFGDSTFYIDGEMVQTAPSVQNFSLSYSELINQSWTEEGKWRIVSNAGEFEKEVSFYVGEKPGLIERLTSFLGF